MPILRFALAFGLCLALPAQAPDAASAAYAALSANDPAQAVAAFRQAILAEPAKPALRKDLAYTLLKTGEREAAREQFAEALRLEPSDGRTALEYAFLCFETKQEVAARRLFLQLSREGAGEVQASAAAAFEKIDIPLKDGIARWQAAVAAAPGQWSAHEELARLSEQRDELSLAAAEYREAWRLRPQERKLMLDLARVWKEQGKTRESAAILLAASRSAEPRLAETAKAMLPDRYPYPYEFAEALELDPGNANLFREYAFLLLAMGRKDEAKQQFQKLIERHPAEEVGRRQLETLEAAPLRPAAVPAKEMAERSLAKGYMKDAYRYLKAAHEEDPQDAKLTLQLGWTANILKRDTEALDWFNEARGSSDAAIAKEASRAYRNLRPDYSRFRVAAWALPMYSTRWGSTLLYGQVKSEFRAGAGRFRPYLSARLSGDTRGTAGTAIGAPVPTYLSETAVILGGGASFRIASGVVAWGEAGEAISYLGERTDTGWAVPDYRGGMSLLYGWGKGARGANGLLQETGVDVVYVSRFDNDTLGYLLNRSGYGFAGENWQVQAFANWNLTRDIRSQYWANYAEFGPGVRVRFPGLPRGMYLRADLMRGVYLENQNNPYRPNYWDLRAGLWYAFVH